MIKIIQAPNPVLSQLAIPVKHIDKSIIQLITRMKETLEAAKDPEGVGLAAPQVGKSLQIFLIKQTAGSPLLIFINPVIEEYIDAPAKQQEANKNEDKKEKGVQLEGCLSLYNIWGVVKRHFGVVVSYLDEHGTRHRKKFEGFIATIIQHEYDHLQGVLFPKRVLEQKNKLYRSSKNSKGEMEFEEISI